MSQTTVNLGYVLKNRGEYIASPETRYYHDNVVQYNGSSFIADPVDYDPEANPLAYITTPPYDADPNQPNEGWKVFASDAAYVNSFMTWKENPEWVEVHLDAEQRILYGVKTDGEFFFGAGCPQQVKDYIEEKILSLSLDEYEDIVSFLSDYLGSDATLKAMIDEINAQIESLDATKVDKEEGKSLIDAEYASTISIIDNPEFIDIKTDAEDRILWGIRTDGNIYYGAGVPQQVIDYIEKKIADLSLDEYEDIVAFLNGLEEGDKALQTLLNEKVDKEEGKSLIDAEYANGVHYINNPEFASVWFDAENKVLFGIQTNGNFLFGCGVPQQIVNFVTSVKSELLKTLQLQINALNSSKVDKIEGKSLINTEYAESQSVIDNPEYVEVETDSESKIISYRKPDGTKVENVGIETANTTTDNLSAKEVSIEGGHATLDSIELTEQGMTEFQQALKDSGFKPDGVCNWSDYISNDGKNPLKLQEPCFAIINLLTDANLLTIIKKGLNGAVRGVNYEIPCQMEFYDLNGNYFKKWIRFSGQGNSSLGDPSIPKRNISIDDLFDSELDGDGFSIKFGDWVAQNSFHLKAFYTDAFRGISPTVFSCYDDIVKTRGMLKDYVWKRGLIDMLKISDKPNGFTDLDDTNMQFPSGARCFPLGFPVAVYQNGTFWGIFSLQLKKHRDNYMMNKKNAKHVHLDGTISGITIFDANGNNTLIGWRNTKDGRPGFEVRNPKDLYCWDGVSIAPYDADLHAWELIDENTPGYNEDNPLHVRSAEVKHYIEDLSRIKTIISNAYSVYDASSKTPEDLNTFKAVFETYFDVENLIDYCILSDITLNYDGFGANWQWLTYNGTKWFIGLYDCDSVFGYGHSYYSLFGAPTNHTGKGVFPMNYILDGNNDYGIYSSELKERYKELRDNGIVSTEYIIDKLLSWINRIGSDNYKAEYKKWNNSQPNSLNVVNEGWELVLDNEGLPISSNQITYDASVTYNIDDTCYYGDDSQSAPKYLFKATEQIIGVAPCQIKGFKDNIYRVYKWISKTINNMDTIYNYNQN